MFSRPQRDKGTPCTIGQSVFCKRQIHPAAEAQVCSDLLAFIAVFSILGKPFFCLRSFLAQRKTVLQVRIIENTTSGTILAQIWKGRNGSPVGAGGQQKSVKEVGEIGGNEGGEGGVHGQNGFLREAHPTGSSSVL